MDIFQRVMDLGFSGYFCSEILVLLALEYKGETNPALVRAASGLNAGMGFTQSACGALTAGCLVFGYFCGKGADGQEANENVNDMIKEYIDWFRENNSGSIECSQIRQANMSLCHNLVAECFSKIIEIMVDYGALEY